MSIKRNTYLLVLVTLLLAISCSYPKNFTRDFYTHNESRLESIKDQFKLLYKQHPFSLLFEEKTFTSISFEFIEDTIKYIYHFNINDPAFIDSLQNLNYDVTKVKRLIEDMRAIQCTWITNLDYYEDLEERQLVLMAVRNKALNSRIKGESYCTLVFFETDQPFNEKGVFLDRFNKKRRRQINGSVLRKVNDKVGYAITRHYR